MQTRDLLKNILQIPFSLEIVAGRTRRIRARRRILVLMYHELSEDHASLDSWTVVRRRDFMSQMEHLRNRFDVVSLDEALQRMVTPGDHHAPTAVITFDDGYSGNERVLLPIIKNINLPVTIFISTRAVVEGSLYWYDRIIMGLQDLRVTDLDLTDMDLGIFRFDRKKGRVRWRGVQQLLQALKALSPGEREKHVSDILSRLPLDALQKDELRPLTIDGVRKLADCSLVSIGAHSHCHSILVQLPPAELKQSIALSKQLLEDWTGRSINHFAYPNGNYDLTVIEAVREEGFVSGFAIRDCWWGQHDSVFAIPRLGIGRYDSMIRFRALTAGAIP